MSIQPECPKVGTFPYNANLTVYDNLMRERTAQITVVPKKSLIRYRYPGEDWQIIEGDNYTLENTPANSETFISRYFIEFEATVNSRFPPQSTAPAKYNSGDTIRGKINTSYHGIVANSITPNNSSSNWKINFDYVQSSSFKNTGRYEETSCYTRNIEVFIRGNETDYKNSFRTSFSTVSNIGVTDLRNFRLIEDTSGQPLICRTIRPKCVFKIYQCENLIHEETREECPEIEFFDCIPDPQNTTTIETELNSGELLFLVSGTGGTLTILETLILEQVGLLYGSFFGSNWQIPLFVEANQNFEECLLILKLSNFETLTTIGQICSGCNCLPPEYEIDCKAKGCPSNTACEIDCGDYICCYDENGINLETIIK